jgi:hypothetical protein
MTFVHLSSAKNDISNDMPEQGHVLDYAKCEWVQHWS